MREAWCKLGMGVGDRRGCFVGYFRITPALWEFLGMGMVMDTGHDTKTRVDGPTR